MGLKPNRVFREPKRAYTRTAKKKVRRAYVRGVPDSKLRSFEMGALNIREPGSYDVVVHLHAGRDCFIRDNALEASRVMANKVFEKKILLPNYRFIMRTYPHQVLREHSMLTGAGADRLSAGMRKAFGKPVGRAASVKKGQCLASIYIKKQYLDVAREGVHRALLKMGGNSKIVVELKK